MTSNKKYILLKAATNIISGISMITIIALGVMYMSFDNAFVFHDIKIEVTNNPVTKEENIELYMVGSKKFECASTEVYGIAYSTVDNHTHRLDKFEKQYVRNTRHGEPIPNQWTMIIPGDMKEGGEYRLSMTGNFICNYFIFQTEKSQTYDNILLIVEPR